MRPRILTLRAMGVVIAAVLAAIACSYFLSNPLREGRATQLTNTPIDSTKLHQFFATLACASGNCFVNSGISENISIITDVSAATNRCLLSGECVTIEIRDGTLTRRLRLTLDGDNQTVSYHFTTGVRMTSYNFYDVRVTFTGITGGSIQVDVMVQGLKNLFA